MYDYCEDDWNRTTVVFICFIIIAMFGICCCCIKFIRSGLRPDVCPLRGPDPLVRTDEPPVQPMESTGWLPSSHGLNPIVTRDVPPVQINALPPGAVATLPRRWDLTPSAPASVMPSAPASCWDLTSSESALHRMDRIKNLMVFQQLLPATVETEEIKAETKSRKKVKKKKNQTTIWHDSDAIVEIRPPNSSDADSKSKKERKARKKSRKPRKNKISTSNDVEMGMLDSPRSKDFQQKKARKQSKKSRKNKTSTSNDVEMDVLDSPRSEDFQQKEARKKSKKSRKKKTSASIDVEMGMLDSNRLEEFQLEADESERIPADSSSLRLLVFSENSDGIDDSEINTSKEAIENQTECPICLDEFQVGDVVVRMKGVDSNLSCNHCFHEACIFEWLKSHDDCPLCRVNFFQEAARVEETDT